jgi:UDP-glucuronate 4-epimerase
MTRHTTKKKQQVKASFPKRILVTGGAGFIGSHVVDQLLAQNDVERVVVIDAFIDNYDPAQKARNVRNHKKDARYRLVRIDIRDAAKVDALMKKERFECVMHLAAACDARKAVDDPKTYLETNVMGTFNLMDSGVRYGTNRFVLASTSSVYGNDSVAPYRETEKADRALTMYGASKKAMEQLAYSYHHNHGTNVVCLRIFNAYGERMRDDLVVPKWVRAIRASEPIKLSGKGTRKRDWTYVGDVARAFLLAAHVDGYDVVNIGSSKPVTLASLLTQIEKALHTKAVVESYPSHHGSVEMTHADTKKAARVLGWKPTVQLAEGIKRYVLWSADRK